MNNLASRIVKDERMGCDEDLYVPRNQPGRSQSSVWHFCRRWYSDGWLQKQKGQGSRMHCLLKPCPKGGVINGSYVANAEQHLRRHHGLSNAEILRQHMLLCDCGCNGVPHQGQDKPAGEKRKVDNDMLHKRAKQLLSHKFKANALPCFGPLTMLPHKRQLVETNYFAAQVCVLDLRPHTIAEGPGFQRWLAKRDLLCESKYKTRLNDHALVSQCLSQHEKEMWPLASAKLNSIDPCRRQSHQDCWTDVFKRHWIIGYESWLCPVSLRFQYLLYESSFLSKTIFDLRHIWGSQRSMIESGSVWMLARGRVLLGSRDTHDIHFIV